jgi:hypothetical protein
MFDIPPEHYPLDEVAEDDLRKESGIFTASCKADDAEERLKAGMTAAKVE